MNNTKVLIGDCRDTLKTLPDESVHCVVTSPPYFGLRDYGVEGQIGLESTPAEFITAMLDVFGEVWRVLRKDGTLWLNMGDSYAANHGSGSVSPGAKQSTNNGSLTDSIRNPKKAGLKQKDMMGMPWRLAFALQDAGWYLRQDIIWSKPNPMPESVRDRCTKSHEYIFLFSKSKKYYFDQKEILEPLASSSVSRLSQKNLSEQAGSQRVPGKTNGSMKAVGRRSGNKQRKDGNHRGCPSGSGSNVCGNVPWEGTTRNKRSVWVVPTMPYSEAHFATYPPALIVPCILAGCPEGGTVLDPFGGSGTTAGVATILGRKSILCELNPEYGKLIPKRVRQIQRDYEHLKQQVLV